MAKITKEILKIKVEELQTQVKEKDGAMEMLRNAHGDEIGVLKTAHGLEVSELKTRYVNEAEESKKQHAEIMTSTTKEYQEKDIESESKIKELEIQNEEQQKQLNFQETKKLAKAYEDQKCEYDDKTKFWSKVLAAASAIFAICFVATMIFMRGKSWQDKVELYAGDIILISVVWFCVSQYSYYVKLYSDFANRQALAQSYSNIINTTEDIVIKDKFLEKATDVLCSPNNIDHKNNLPVEKVLNDTFEVLKNISKVKPNIV